MPTLHMDYTGHNALGTCKGLQMQGTNSSICHRAYGSTKMARVKESHGRDNMDVTCEIHRMEMEAYNAVLRAFIAQSSVLSWGKEGLITELRKELNVTDIEHRELLMKIDSNESIRMIREWRKGTSYAQEPPPSKMNTAGIVPSSERYAAQKKLKTSHTSVPMSQKYISHGQPSSPADPASVPAKLKNGENHRELVVFSTGNAGLPMNAVGHKIQAPSSIKGRATGASQTKMAFHAPDGGNFKKRYDLIEIRETDKLIQEVERMIFGRENPDLYRVESAKSILREHEAAILEALAKLAEVSDADDHPNHLQHHFSHDELPGIEQQMVLRNNFYGGHMDRLNGYFGEGFVQTHFDRFGGHCNNNLQDDEDTL